MSDDKPRRKRMNFNTIIVSVLLAVTGYFGRGINEKVQVNNDRLISVIANQEHANFQLLKLENRMDEALPRHEADIEWARINTRLGQIESRQAQTDLEILKLREALQLKRP